MTIEKDSEVPNKTEEKDEDKEKIIEVDYYAIKKFISKDIYSVHFSLSNKFILSFRRYGKTTTILCLKNTLKPTNFLSLSTP